MISSGKESISIEDIKHIPQSQIASKYLNIKRIPCVINSPLRRDKHPSFALYTPNGTDVNYKDFSTGESGGIYKLLSLLWHCKIPDVRIKIYHDFKCDNTHDIVVRLPSQNNNKNIVMSVNEKSELQCKIRDWEDYDIEYWNSYGVDIKWLKYCEVYPISHKIIKRGNRISTFRADKYAYTFVERKEGRVTHKFYQPFNTNGYKWQNSHDKSVLGLWSKMPPSGDKVCICSSVKDALCLMSNLNIPCICLQGEGYPISDTAIRELRNRFKFVLVCLDNDDTGIRDARKLQEETGFINVEIPKFEGGKDISDYYKCYGKEKFNCLFKTLIETAIEYGDLPF